MFTRQIAFSKNHLQPILSGSWNHMFLQLNRLDNKLELKLSKKWIRHVEIPFLDLRYFTTLPLENSNLPVESGSQSCPFFLFFFLRAVPIRIQNRKQKQSLLSGMFGRISFIPNY